MNQEEVTNLTLTGQKEISCLRKLFGQFSRDLGRCGKSQYFKCHRRLLLHVPRKSISGYGNSDVIGTCVFHGSKTDNLLLQHW